jgi:hypothetical protein
MRIIVIILTLGFIIGCASQHATNEDTTDVLVFQGTVTKIENSPIPRSTQNWIITMRVDQILSGEFKGDHFSFRIHSPTKSGLTENGTYRIEASQSQDGYVVNAIQLKR